MVKQTRSTKRYTEDTTAVAKIHFRVHTPRAPPTWQVPGGEPAADPRECVSSVESSGKTGPRRYVSPLRLLIKKRIAGPAVRRRKSPTILSAELRRPGWLGRLKPRISAMNLQISLVLPCEIRSKIHSFGKALEDAAPEAGHRVLPARSMTGRPSLLLGFEPIAKNHRGGAKSPFLLARRKVA